MRIGFEGVDKQRDLEFDSSADMAARQASLNLKLTKTNSFLDLVSSYSAEENCETSRYDSVVKERAQEKIPPSNFPVKMLKIGSWEIIARNAAHLVAKIYYSKRKILWEILDDALKSKIEMEFCDVSAIKAIFTEDKPDVLIIEFEKPPSFYKEVPPQPRKHTEWNSNADFTNGQASLYWTHYLEFQEGTLRGHYEKLLRADVRISNLSKQPFQRFSSPYINASAVKDEEYNHPSFNGYAHRSNDMSNPNILNAINPAMNVSDSAPFTRFDRQSPAVNYPQIMPSSNAAYGLPSSAYGLQQQAAFGMNTVASSSGAPRTSRLLAFPKSILIDAAYPFQQPARFNADGTTTDGFPRQVDAIGMNTVLSPSNAEYGLQQQAAVCMNPMPYPSARGFQGVPAVVRGLMQQQDGVGMHLIPSSFARGLMPQAAAVGYGMQQVIPCMHGSSQSYDPMQQYRYQYQHDNGVSELEALENELAQPSCWDMVIFEDHLLSDQQASFNDYQRLLAKVQSIGSALDQLTPLAHPEANQQLQSFHGAYGVFNDSYSSGGMLHAAESSKQNHKNFQGACDGFDNGNTSRSMMHPEANQEKEWFQGGSGGGEFNNGN